MPQSEPHLPDIESVSDARSALEDLLTAGLFCEWCLTRMRRAYPDYDEAEAVALSVGETKQTFQAKGHRIAADGTVDAAVVTVLPVPDATVTYAPDSTGKTVYCPGCDRADGRARGETWTQKQRHLRFENLVDGLAINLDRDTGHDAISRANQNCDLDDLDVVARGLFDALAPR